MQNSRRGETEAMEKVESGKTEAMRNVERKEAEAMLYGRKQERSAEENCARAENTVWASLFFVGVTRIL